MHIASETRSRNVRRPSVLCTLLRGFAAAMLVFGIRSTYFPLCLCFSISRRNGRDEKQQTSTQLVHYVGSSWEWEGSSVTFVPSEVTGVFVALSPPLPGIKNRLAASPFLVRRQGEAAVDRGGAAVGIGELLYPQTSG